MLAVLITGLLLVQECLSRGTLVKRGVAPDQKDTSPVPEKTLELFSHTGQCNTQHGRDLDDPDYYTTNSGVPHFPAATGFMATHGTPRFMSVFEQVALVIGEPKHGIWRFQENGFIRVYREVGKEGIPPEKKEDVLDLKEKGADEEMNKLFDIVRDNYMHIDPKISDFDYAFGDETSMEQGETWLNWIDLPIFHPKFGGKYEDHVPIDLALWYCQVSSVEYPHLKAAWDLMKAQPRANEAGPLGKRAGMDIQEIFSNVVRFQLFEDAGIWANIGQGNPETDPMLQTLNEMKERVQTVNYQRVDMKKVTVEVYFMERPYHNGAATYIHSAVVLLDEANEASGSYIRPHGRYYDYLVDQGQSIKSTTPNNNPTVFVETEAEEKQIYGLPGYGHHHMNRLKLGVGSGAGCPTKGGDASIYPWGNTGAAYPTNYEEITPLCDALVMDMKLWANLDKPWTDPTLNLGNAGVPLQGQTQVTYQVGANYYGKYTDPYNVEEGAKNPHELDFTGNNKVQENPGADKSSVPVVEFTLDFGKIGEVLSYNDVELDYSPRQCLQDQEYTEEWGRWNAAQATTVPLGILAILLLLWC